MIKKTLNIFFLCCLLIILDDLKAFGFGLDNSAMLMPPGASVVYHPILGQMVFVDPIAVSTYFNWNGAQPMGASLLGVPNSQSYIPPIGMSAIQNSMEFSAFADFMTPPPVPFYRRPHGASSADFDECIDCSD